jgi:hypothetical protein
MEQAFLRFDEEVVFSKSGQDHSDVFMMVVAVLRENEDVIEVDYNEDVSHVLEDVIHEELECCRGIHQSEWHDKVFEGAVTCAKGSLPLLTRSDPNIVISCTKVKLGVDVRTFELVDEVRNEGYRVLVLSGETVQASVVDEHSQRTILLFCEDYRCAAWGLQ